MVRTYPYNEVLPYTSGPLSSPTFAADHLKQVLKDIYITLAAEDYPAAYKAVHELKNYLALKNDLSPEERAKLVHIFYDVCMHKSMDASSFAKFASIFQELTRKRWMIEGIPELDWRPLHKEVLLALGEGESLRKGEKDIGTLVKLTTHAQSLFGEEQLLPMLKEFLPLYNTTNNADAVMSVGLMNLFLPTTFTDTPPQSFVPALFNLWNLNPSSPVMDTLFIDYFSRLARDSMVSHHVVFTEEQIAKVFGTILRNIPLPHSFSRPKGGEDRADQYMYSYLKRSENPVGTLRDWARFVVYQFHEESVWRNLETFIHGVETYFYPSNSGRWSDILVGFVYYLTEFTVLRWNKENGHEPTKGEPMPPPEKKLTEEHKDRLVRLLRGPIFMSIYAKSGNVVSTAQSALSSLAYLSPNLVIPGALKRFYPSLSGLVETHRTSSSLGSLRVLAKTLCAEPRWRAHVPSLLMLALPGIDPNDLDKTVQTLKFIEAVSMLVPFWEENDGEEGLADGFVMRDIQEFEEMKGDDMPEAMEEIDLDLVQKSAVCRGVLGEFITAFLGKLFILLENLPEASSRRSKHKSGEDRVTSELPIVCLALFSSLSPELFEIALTKVTHFVTNTVVHHGGMPFMCIVSALAKARPAETTAKLLPIFLRSIRFEVAENDAGAGRTTLDDDLPRDRALVWYFSLLRGVLAACGNQVIRHAPDLREFMTWMYSERAGSSVVGPHLGSFLFGLFHSLTVIYADDTRLKNDDSQGYDINDWGVHLRPRDLCIKWHVPSDEEVSFAVELYLTLVEKACGQLDALIRDGEQAKGKETSDVLKFWLRLLSDSTGGLADLFDASRGESLDPKADEERKVPHQYPTGYFFSGNPDDERYVRIHEARDRIGKTLHSTHQFLIAHKEDDVECFQTWSSCLKTWFMDVGCNRTVKLYNRLESYYSSSKRPFQMSGLSKPFPRPVMIRRAALYHIELQRHNLGLRKRTELDTILLKDLAGSCVSVYTLTRLSAQSALESAIKVINGTRTVLAPFLLNELAKGVEANNHDKVKGAVFTFLMKAMHRTVTRDWRFTADYVLNILKLRGMDKLSLQALSQKAYVVTVMEVKATPPVLRLPETILTKIYPQGDETKAEVDRLAAKVKRKIVQRNERRLELREKLLMVAKESHWKTSVMASGMGLGSLVGPQEMPSPDMVKMIIKGAIDEHPSVRVLHASTLSQTVQYIWQYSLSDGSIEKLLRDEVPVPNSVKLPTPRDPDFTLRFVKSFGEPVGDVLVDQTRAGWLVWPDEYVASKIPEDHFIFKTNDVTQPLVDALAGLDHAWFEKLFSYMKEEPREGHSEVFRPVFANALTSILGSLRHFPVSETAVLQEVQTMVAALLADGDKHHQRAGSEGLAALVMSTKAASRQEQEEVWTWALPLLKTVFDEKLTPENLGTWTGFVSHLFHKQDPRRAMPLMKMLSEFRLNMHSNEAFKESARIALLRKCMALAGWHYTLEEPIVSDFLAHLDHPYKGVREEIAKTLWVVYNRQRYYAYASVEDLLAAKKLEPVPRANNPLDEVFAKIIPELHEHRQNGAGTEEATPYKSAGKTLAIWLRAAITADNANAYVPYMPRMIPEALPMVDVKEDTDLQQLTAQFLVSVGTVQYPPSQHKELIGILAEIAKTAESWHHRARVMSIVHVIYFSSFYILSEENKAALRDIIISLLADSQVEVRESASLILTGIVRLSPDIIPSLIEKYAAQLDGVPRRTSPPHEPILALSTLIRSFPYGTPPPWAPPLLARLARIGGSNSPVGRTIKNTLGEFKKTRSDNWKEDSKCFTAEELEDLEGVVGHRSYFA
ncbi:hypothetical protein SAICODRAFT_114459 [Saitoella complicata NRRL Y-17804]|uniref:Proteasome activator Blm10 mid region domain-containing protein n=1 Tax=Saitoella complicata (strain BCRC 22490 / CBS 7301 / JCM 7358 / NBRC 10748 / NRRL Y-17804) TaxID=698492 RepID=A0A0E9NSI7_SAICN|nr:uncharacterized protein SAICODRAFT_114459 [Saitoella complicata NRRL Y-17804]ODQ53425.1 hypothetical protein SAICODRAFT_114459 [Saitoella complicata NRRL Y-17804]GAO52380.1 hypothetical protein G7K_6458-t1 [Saitoella complicata NRRL Y-17804]